MSTKVYVTLEIECDFEDEGTTGEAVFYLTKALTKSGYWNIRKITARDGADVTLKVDDLKYQPSIFGARSS